MHSGDFELIPSASRDGPGWAEAPFLARLTAVYTVVKNDGTNLPVNENLYSFIEQIADASSGVPSDMLGGRQTSVNAITNIPFDSWAVEINNALLTVPGGAVPGSSQAGPFVEMRLKGLARGVPVYEFGWPSPYAFVAVSSAIPQTVFLGRTVTATLSGSIMTVTSGTLSTSDVGSIVLGTGLPTSPPYTTISAVVTTVTPPFATLSAPASSGVGVQVVISNRQYLAFQAVAGSATGDAASYTGYSLNTSAWLFTPNTPDPNNNTIPAYHGVWPLATNPGHGNSGALPFLGYNIGSDAYSTPIYVWAYDPAARYDFAPQSVSGSATHPPLAIYGQEAGGNGITVGQSFIIFGYLTDQGTAFGSDLYTAPGNSATNAGIAPQAYLGDTGADGIGNQFVNGINVSVGGSGTNIVINGGSFWPS